MLLVIDNYDSFTYNLVQYLGELGVEMKVFRNDEITLDQIRDLKPSRLLISPGPCSPKESGLSNDIIRTFGPTTPTLGVCLGHQCMGHVFGGEVVRAERLMHGKTSEISHDGQGVLAGLPSPFTAMRYHSLVVEDLPEELEPIAWSADEGWGRELMAARHRRLPIQGVQFHPESIGTPVGKRLLANFLALGQHNPERGWRDPTPRH